MQDDFSSQASTISSRDVDSTSKSSSLLDEFPPGKQLSAQVLL